MANLNTPTRRGLLGAMAAVSAAAALGTIALSPASASSAAWDRALAGYKAARRKFDATAQAQSDAENRYYALMKKVAKPKNGLTIRAGETVPEAQAKARGAAKAYNLADEAAEIAAGLPAATAANESACDVDDEALALMINTPAPNIAALIEKMEIIDANCLSSTETRVAIDDLKRIAAMGGL